MRVQAVVALMVLVALSFGCGESEKTYKAADQATPSRVGDNSIALPADFPKDVPIPKGATLKVVMWQGEHMVVQLYTNVSIADAVKFYNVELKAQGWKIESSTNAGDMVIVSATKGKTLCGVTVAKEGKKTLVRLSVSQAGS